MAFVGKSYVLDRTENFDEFVKSLKIPDDLADLIIKAKAKQTLEKNGDEYVLTSVYNERTMVSKFKNGVEFDETVGPKGKAKTTFTVEGDKVTQVQKFPDGNTITLVREYYPDKIEATITTNFWPGTAKRFYVAE
ncbi:unnamed protein product [Colias eurytheme]|nr:unnamed protein product [Colias eurytheme]